MGMARGGGSARVGNESQEPRAFPPGGLLDTGPGMRQVRAATFFSRFRIAPPSPVTILTKLLPLSPRVTTLTLV